MSDSFKIVFVKKKEMRKFQQRKRSIEVARCRSFNVDR